MLSESEVQRAWTRVFKEGPLGDETFDRAEALLDEVRAESPLRHRLQSELEELRQIHASSA